jgi:ribosomal protein S18 acetylase RimI-like enzyme
MIVLAEMPRERFAGYRDHLVRDYAREKDRAGAWSSEEAPRRHVDGQLPEGTDTEGHHLYLLRDRATAEEVGIVWIAVRDSEVGRSVWVYDIQVHEPFRRRGHATRALRAIESAARDLGADSVGLHVFGHNCAARALYERLGYETTSVIMRRRLR